MQPRRNLAASALACCFLLVIGCSLSLEVLEPAALRSNKILSPNFACVGHNSSLSGIRGVFWEALDITNQTALDASLDGAAVLIWSNYTQSSRLGVPLGTARWAFEWFKQKGVKAVVVFNTQSNQPGGNEVLVDRWDWCRELYPLLVVEIGLADAKTMINWTRTYPNQLVLHFPGGEDSPWRNVRHHPIMIAFQVWFACLSAPVAIVALMKLIAFFHYRGLRPTLATILLSIEFVTNLWRLIYFSLDPVYLGRVFVGPTAHGLGSITWPVNIITLLLVGLYYQEVLTSNRLHVADNVQRFKKPFIGITIAILLLEIVSAAIRSSRVGTLYVLVYITTAYYAVANLILGVYYTVIGSKVLGYFKKSRTELNVTTSAANRDTMTRVTIFILVTSVCAFISVIGYILAATPFFWTPVGHYVAWFVIYTGLMSASLTQVLSVRMPTSHIGSRKATRSMAHRSSASHHTSDSRVEDTSTHEPHSEPSSHVVNI